MLPPPLQPSQILGPSLPLYLGPPVLSPLHPAPPVATLDTDLAAEDGWGQTSAVGARGACGEVTCRDRGLRGGGKQRGYSGAPPSPPNGSGATDTISLNAAGCWGSGDGSGGDITPGVLMAFCPQRWWHWARAEILPCFAQSRLFSPNWDSALASALGSALKSLPTEETLWPPYAARWPRGGLRGKLWDWDAQQGATASPSPPHPSHPRACPMPRGASSAPSISRLSAGPRPRGRY